MTISELFKNSTIKPDASYTGVETADDFVLAICTDADTQATPDAYIVCQDHVTEHSGAINSGTTDKTYIRAGTATLKTSVQRTFSISGDRYVGDAFQDFALSHKIRYGIGQDVIVPYVWISRRTGKGEQGTASLIVTADASGAAGNDAGFAADLKSIGAPDEYTYTVTAS
jgi:hypothetical protein